jgi:hypothetical protein
MFMYVFVQLFSFICSFVCLSVLIFYLYVYVHRSVENCYDGVAGETSVTVCLKHHQLLVDHYIIVQVNYTQRSLNAP